MSRFRRFVSLFKRRWRFFIVGLYGIIKLYFSGPGRPRGTPTRLQAEFMETEAKVDLKTTINLPDTTFPLKGNLAQNEPARLKKWEEMDVYARLREARAGRRLYVLHDGPPYANGLVHLGTALNKILKDFCVKSRAMMGFWTPYIPGWDCHGLPIEIQVDRELGARKSNMSTLEIRRAARRHAERYVGEQREEFKRLGILGEWEDPYLT